MKKIRVILFLMLSICILVSCGKNNYENNYENKENQGVIKAKSYEEVPEIDFSIKDKNLAKKVIENIAQNPNKIDIYNNMVLVYTSEINPDGFYTFYTSTFLDKNNKFSKPMEKKLNEFIMVESGKDYYENFYKTIVPEVKKMIKKDSENKYKDLDNSAQDFIDSLDKKVAVMKDIVKYYNEKEYQKDNYEKGKKLSEQYIASYEETEIKYNNFYKKFKEYVYILMKHNLEEVKGNKVSENIIKTVILTDMLMDEFAGNGSKLVDISPALIYKIPKEDKSGYINNLKSIEKTLKIVISDIEKVNKDKIVANNINLDKYNEFVNKIKEISALTEKIIDKIQNQRNEEINEMIIEYFKRRQEMLNLSKNLK